MRILIQDKGLELLRVPTNGKCEWTVTFKRQNYKKLTENGLTTYWCGRCQGFKRDHGTCILPINCMKHFVNRNGSAVPEEAPANAAATTQILNESVAAWTPPATQTQSAAVQTPPEVELDASIFIDALTQPVTAPGTVVTPTDTLEATREMALVPAKLSNYNSEEVIAASTDSNALVEAKRIAAAKANEQVEEEATVEDEPAANPNAKPFWTPPVTVTVVMPEVVDASTDDVQEEITTADPCPICKKVLHPSETLFCTVCERSMHEEAIPGLFEDYSQNKCEAVTNNLHVTQCSIPSDEADVVVAHNDGVKNQDNDQISINDCEEDSEYSCRAEDNPWYNEDTNSTNCNGGGPHWTKRPLREMTEDHQLQATIRDSMNDPNGEDEDEEEEEDEITTQGTTFQPAQRFNVPSIEFLNQGTQVTSVEGTPDAHLRMQDSNSQVVISTIQPGPWKATQETTQDPLLGMNVRYTSHSSQVSTTTQNASLAGTQGTQVTSVEGTPDAHLRMQESNSQVVTPTIQPGPWKATHEMCQKEVATDVALREMTEDQQLHATIRASMNEPNGKDEDKDEEEEDSQEPIVAETAQITPRDGSFDSQETRLDRDIRTIASLDRSDGTDSDDDDGNGSDEDYGNDSDFSASVSPASSASAVSASSASLA
eukprot:scaffold108030_cov69-Attheya_sp.AAC.1